MPLSAHLESWSGEALRHVPAGARFDVLDFRYAGRGADNRWNEPGHPTLYLAGDEGVLIAEWGRHFTINRTPQLQQKVVERQVYSLTLAVDYVIDMRKPVVWEEISLESAPYCFTDIGTARATSHFIRHTTEAQGMLVPSLGFIDNLDRWCLVLFLEKLSDPKSFISTTTHRGPLRMG